MTTLSRKKLLSVNSAPAVKNVRYYKVSSDNSRLEPTVKSPSTTESKKPDSRLETGKSVPPLKERRLNGDTSDDCQQYINQKSRT